MKKIPQSNLYVNTSNALKTTSDGVLYRDFDKGMGQAVAERTYLRKDKDLNWETWGDVAKRVSKGNSLLVPSILEDTQFSSINEYAKMRQHISKATLLMSGRHLQHGDESQATATMEAYTNCSTSSTSFLLFLLLMSGSGVGRCYDDDFIAVNWDNAPTVLCVLDEKHSDFKPSAHISVRDAKHRFGSGKGALWFKVPDTREGWAKAVEVLENSAFEKIHKDKMLILDFSDIRCSGSPIKGMQGRPASGPVPLMDAFNKINTLKGAHLDPWLQSMFVDHFLADCVLVGGARRSARIATKYWKDKSILDFIKIKRPIEFEGMSTDEIIKYRKEMGGATPLGFLWSSNNSIGVDKEFWDLVALKKGEDGYSDDLAAHARKVFKTASECGYADGTGEPGFLNLDKLTQRDNDGRDFDEWVRGDFIGSSRYQIEEDTQIYISKIVRKMKKKKYKQIVNPCGEISLLIMGGFCVIADVVPFFADTLDEAEDAFRVATRSLMRVNLMDSIYKKEVNRTNRIGVGITGIHEFAYKFFGYGFNDLLDEEKSKDFWLTLDRFNRAVREESISYAKLLGVTVPHTSTTVKPSGTISKLFGLTEGWHLPSMEFYLRYVQFAMTDPLINIYKEIGYPTRDLTKYQNVTIVGFPTSPYISTLGMGDKLVLAGDATPDEQYKWLKLGEKYWIDGLSGGECYGNQISYTLKFKPENMSIQQFKDMLISHQSDVKACSVMPQSEHTSYEYQPETPITNEEYYSIMAGIKTNDVKEEVDRAHLDCSTGGACPISFVDRDIAMVPV
jgi:adenosylcobalamin-dependent ribonucleoside-triphosphate reductase